MSPSIKGPGAKPTSGQAVRGQSVQAAAERAFIRLKKTKRGGEAAEVLGEFIDDVVGGQSKEAESEEARQLMDAVSVDPPGADDMEKAQTIANSLGEAFEATRERRRPLTDRIEKDLDDLV